MTDLPTEVPAVRRAFTELLFDVWLRRMPLEPADWLLIHGALNDLNAPRSTLWMWAGFWGTSLALARPLLGVRPVPKLVAGWSAFLGGLYSAESAWVVRDPYPLSTLFREADRLGPDESAISRRLKQMQRDGRLSKASGWALHDRDQPDPRPWWQRARSFACFERQRLGNTASGWAIVDARLLTRRVSEDEMPSVVTSGAASAGGTRRDGLFYRKMIPAVSSGWRHLGPQDEGVPQTTTSKNRSAAARLNARPSSLGSSDAAVYAEVRLASLWALLAADHLQKHPDPIMRGLWRLQSFTSRWDVQGALRRAGVVLPPRVQHQSGKKDE